MNSNEQTFVKQSQSWHPIAVFVDEETVVHAGGCDVPLVKSNAAVDAFCAVAGIPTDRVVAVLTVDQTVCVEAVYEVVAMAAAQRVRNVECAEDNVVTLTAVDSDAGEVRESGCRHASDTQRVGSVAAGDFDLSDQAGWKSRDGGDRRSIRQNLDERVGLRIRLNHDRVVVGSRRADHQLASDEKARH